MPALHTCRSFKCTGWQGESFRRMQSFKMIFSGVIMLQGVEFPIFLLIFAWALQQWGASALRVMFWANLTGYLGGSLRLASALVLRNRLHCIQQFQVVQETSRTCSQSAVATMWLCRLNGCTGHMPINVVSRFIRTLIWWRLTVLLNRLLWLPCCPSIQVSNTYWQFIEMS